MTQPQEPKAAEAKEMTAAGAAKLVKRTVLVPAKGDEPATTKEVAIKESEVLAFKDYGDSVGVVTTDGQKLTGDK